MAKLPDDAWRDVQERFGVGDIVDVTVDMRQVFGAFVKLPGTEVPGLIEIVSFDDVPNRDRQLPPVGTQLRARILGFRDSNQQVILTAKPSALADV